MGIRYFRVYTLQRCHQRLSPLILLWRGFCGFWIAISNEIWRFHLRWMHIECREPLLRCRKYFGQLFLGSVCERIGDSEDITKSHQGEEGSAPVDCEKYLAMSASPRLTLWNTYPINANDSASTSPNLYIRRKQASCEKYAGNHTKDDHWSIITLVIYRLPR